MKEIYVVFSVIFFLSGYFRLVSKYVVITLHIVGSYYRYYIWKFLILTDTDVILYRTSSYSVRKFLGTGHQNTGKCHCSNRLGCFGTGFHSEWIHLVGKEEKYHCNTQGGHIHWSQLGTRSHRGNTRKRDWKNRELKLRAMGNLAKMTATHNWARPFITWSAIYLNRGCLILLHFIGASLQEQCLATRSFQWCSERTNRGFSSRTCSKRVQGQLSFENLINETLHPRDHWRSPLTNLHEWRLLRWILTFDT